MLAKIKYCRGNDSSAPATPHLNNEKLYPDQWMQVAYIFTAGTAKLEQSSHPRCLELTLKFK
jgi:hypothetical protein